MGPDNPLDILDVRVTSLPHGIRRTDTFYPDGVEVEFAFRMPASDALNQVVGEHTPKGAFLVGIHTDEGSDGLTRGFCQWWLVCTSQCGSCPVNTSGVTDHLCKLVEA
ncbi:hypothetical protein GCM10009560_79090 [Nonomuraea longicatena]|uniref:Uncharacterized protein n=1 Tax=Nonomuraea longicatena TaxID=83682 RepID=A0ABP4BX94_9ACTN